MLSSPFLTSKNDENERFLLILRPERAVCGPVTGATANAPRLRKVWGAPKEGIPRNSLCLERRFGMLCRLAHRGGRKTLVFRDRKCGARARSRSGPRGCNAQALFGCYLRKVSLPFRSTFSGVAVGFAAILARRKITSLDGKEWLS